jgi:glycosyltransferase involved in cell wall biosynthesis
MNNMLLNTNLKEIIVSVIIPTYNRCDYVQEAIDSVLNQTYRKYELIVVDDGSTDGTKEVIEKKYKGKLQYYWQRNKGESRARNYGISLAKGKFLAFLDSDDKWHPEKLHYQVDELERRLKENKKIALLCSSVWLIDANGKLINSQPSGRTMNIEKYEIEDFLFRPRIFAPPSNAIFVTEYVKNVGCFREDIQYGEDWLLLIKLREKFNFAYLDKPLTYYRIHNVNQQRFPTIDVIDKKLADYLLLIANFPKQIDKELVNKAKALSYMKAGFWCFLYEEWDKGRLYLISSENLDKNLLNNQNEIVHWVAKSGIESSLINSEKSVSSICNYFNKIYIKNIKHNWPNNNILKTSIQKKIWAQFCHSLLFESEAQCSEKDIRFLSLQAFQNNPRYLLSATTWKFFLKSLLHVL